MSIVTHVREKSNARNSARTLLLNLAIYANDCCGVAWPADATLRHETNVGDENEKRTGIVNPLNSASTHTMTSFSLFNFCSSFCTNFQGIDRLLPPPKG
jgi:hypothetical protein